MTKRNLIRIKNFIWDTVSEGKNPSSKRVAGCTGWILCLISSIVALFHLIPNPDIIEMLFWSSCALLGLDSVTTVFRPKPRNPNFTDLSKDQQDIKKAE